MFSSSELPEEESKPVTIHVSDESKEIKTVSSADVNALFMTGIKINQEIDWLDLDTREARLTEFVTLCSALDEAMRSENPKETAPAAMMALESYVNQLPEKLRQLETAARAEDPTFLSANELINEYEKTYDEGLRMAEEMAAVDPLAVERHHIKFSPEIWEKISDSNLPLRSRQRDTSRLKAYITVIISPEWEKTIAIKNIILGIKTWLPTNKEAIQLIDDALTTIHSIKTTNPDESRKLFYEEALIAHITNYLEKKYDLAPLKEYVSNLNLQRTLYKQLALIDSINRNINALVAENVDTLVALRENYQTRLSATPLTNPEEYLQNLNNSLATYIRTSRELFDETANPLLIEAEENIRKLMKYEPYENRQNFYDACMSSLNDIPTIEELTFHTQTLAKKGQLIEEAEKYIDSIIDFEPNDAQKELDREQFYRNLTESLPSEEKLTAYVKSLGEELDLKQIEAAEIREMQRSVIVEAATTCINQLLKFENPGEQEAFRKRHKSALNKIDDLDALTVHVAELQGLLSKKQTDADAGAETKQSQEAPVKNTGLSGLWGILFPSKKPNPLIQSKERDKKAAPAAVRHTRKSKPHDLSERKFKIN